MNRIREAKHQASDIEKLLTCLRTKEEMKQILRHKPDMMFMFATNEEVDRFNDECVQYLDASDSIHIIKAVDVPRTRQLKSHKDGNEKIRRLPLDQIPESAKDAGGLQTSITLAINSRVMLVRNLNTDSGKNG